MSWQDLVFTIGQFIFVIALIPSIRSNDKPAFLTSLMTALILASFAVSYATLQLWGSMIGAIANTTAWSVLAIQKFLIDKKTQSNK